MDPAGLLLTTLRSVVVERKVHTMFPIKYSFVSLLRGTISQFWHCGRNGEEGKETSAREQLER